MQGSLPRLHLVASVVILQARLVQREYRQAGWVDSSAPRAWQRPRRQPNLQQAARWESARWEREHAGSLAPGLRQSLAPKRSALWDLWPGRAAPPARLRMGSLTLSR